MHDLLGRDVTVDSEETVDFVEYNPNLDFRIDQAILEDSCLIEN